MNLQEMLESNPELKEAWESTLEEQATVKAQEATAGLLKKRDELLAEKKAVKSEFEEFKSKYDPEKYQEALELIKQKEEAEMTLEQRSAKREQELLEGFKSRETELLKKNESALEVLRGEVKAKDASLKDYLVEKELHSAISVLDGIPDLLVPVLRDKIKVVENEGKYEARVFDGDTPRVGGSDGSYMTISQLVEETKANPIFGGAFKASGASGGSAKGSDSSGTGGLATKRSEMSPKDKADYIEKKGYDAYMQLDY